MEGDVLMLSTVGYLDRARMQFFQSGGSSVATLNFPETVVRDLEVVNRGVLRQLLNSFFRDHLIRPSPFILVVSETSYFWQALTGQEHEKELQFQQFIETIPFDSLSFKRYKLGEKEVGIVMPKQFYEILQQILVEDGFDMIAVVPAFVLGTTEGGKRWMDVDMGKYVLKETNELARQSIITSEAAGISPTTRSTVVINFVSKNRRITFLVSLFIILIIILIFLILRFL